MDDAEEIVGNIISMLINTDLYWELIYQSIGKR